GRAQLALEPQHRGAIGDLGAQPPAPGGVHQRDPDRCGPAVPEEENRLMWPIFKAQYRNLMRAPWGVLIMVILTVAMSLVFGFQATSAIEVGVLPDAELTEAETTAWLELLSESDVFRFSLENEEQVLAYLQSNTSGLAVRVGLEDWQVVAAENDANAALLASYVGGVYRQELSVRAAAERSGRDVAALRADMAERLARPALTIQSSAVEAADDFEYNPRVHTLL